MKTFQYFFLRHLSLLRIRSRYEKISSKADQFNLFDILIEDFADLKTFDSLKKDFPVTIKQENFSWFSKRAFVSILEFVVSTFGEKEARHCKSQHNLSQIASNRLDIFVN